MNLLFNKFYAADEASGGAPAAEQETFELLNEEEPEVLELPTKQKEEVEDEEVKGEEAGEEDELREIEEELKKSERDEEEEDEENIDELITPVKRREILAKYPKLFKDFPYLEKAYYREQQFTEVYPTVKDARVAAEKAAILDKTEQAVMGGDISSILAAAKQESQEVFNKIADNYLPTLKRIDQQAYYHVLGGVIKDTIVTMVRESRNLGEQGAPLQAAANILNQFVFGSQNFRPHQPLSKQVNPGEQQREHEFRQQEQRRTYDQFTSVKDDLQTKADNVLKSTIDGHIDPRGTMSDYVKKHATQEAFENLETLLSKDLRFRSLLDKLWEKAFESKFDKGSTDKIKAAYLSKAKTLLPSVIKKARNDALREKSSSAEVHEEMTPKRGPITPGRSTAQSSGKYKKASDIPRGMSTLDVLMKD